MNLQSCTIRTKAGMCVCLCACVRVLVSIGRQKNLLGLPLGLHPGVHASHQHPVVQVRAHCGSFGNNNNNNGNNNNNNNNITFYF